MKNQLEKEVKNVIEGLISDAKVYGSLNQTHDDFRVFVDEGNQQLAIMFKDATNQFGHEWNGHLYEIQDDKLEIVEYGAFDCMAIEDWPNCDFVEVELKW